MRTRNPAIATAVPESRQGRRISVGAWQPLPREVTFTASKVRRGGFVFLTWAGDHGPRRVHVYRDGRFVLKWDLDNRQAMRGKESRRVLALIEASGVGGLAMRILSVSAKARRRAFEVELPGETHPFPYSKCVPVPSPEDPVAEVFVDAELDGEAFTFRLKSGAEGPYTSSRSWNTTRTRPTCATRSCTG